jgi:hypothetical protein
MLVGVFVFNCVSFFDCFLLDMTRRYSELEEKHLQYQANSTRGYFELEGNIPKVRSTWPGFLLL